MTYAGAGAASLLAPLLAYLVYEQYPAGTPEVMAIVAGCALAGASIGYAASRLKSFARVALLACLLALAIDGLTDLAALWCALGAALLALSLRSHLATVALATFSAFAAAILIIPEHGPVLLHTRVAQSPPAAGTGAPIVHLLLDEHTGSAGIPSSMAGGPAARRDLEAAYTHLGLRLHSHAYSELFETEVSLARTFNPGISANPTRLVTLIDGQRSLARNDYFKRLAALGYRLTIIQSRNLDFCAGAGEALHRCTTYPSNAIRDIAGLQISSSEKLASLVSHGANRLQFYTSLRDFYRLATLEIEAFGLAVPQWDWDGDLTAPINAALTWPQVMQAATNLGTGEMLFAHLVLPHHPYVFDARCGINSSLYRRLDMTDASLPGPEPNSARGRALRWQHYLAQMSCTTRRVTEMIQALDTTAIGKAATVIIHGDHGARITTLHPFHQFAARLTAANLRDNYSTLFAWRHTDAAAGVDPCPQSILTLLNAVGQANGSARVCNADLPQTVLMQDTRQGNFVWHKVRMFE